MSNYKSFNPKDLSLPEVHGFLLTSIAPRPICFASTVDQNGLINLAPFSQFNVFSTNPPIIIFSASVSGRTGETKDTYKNIKEVPEVVVNIVEYDMAYQMSYASSEFPRGVNEFIKSGFTSLASEIVKPPRVSESPVQFECKVLEVKEFGNVGGSGNIFICEVIKIHINERVLGNNGKIDPLKLDLIGRCGAGYYVHAEVNKLFEIAQPQSQLGIGVDALKESIRNSNVLTGNNLGQLALNMTFASEDEINDFKNTESYKYLMTFEGEERQMQFHRAAQDLLNNNNNRLALIVLYSL